jgi:hypothetical protein
MSTAVAASAAPHTGYRCGRRRVGVQAGLAAEHGGGYGPPRDGSSSVRVPDTGAAGRAREAPFGLPVLAEVPRLASVLEHLAAAERAQLAAVAELADLLAGDEVERTTGVGVDHWLAAVGRLTRMDRRLLVSTCRLLHRLPTLDAAVRTGRVSFAQLRGLTLTLRPVRRELDDQVDRVLSALLDGLGRFDRPDPDVLVRQVADAVDELDADDLADRERDSTGGRYLTLEPRLDGTGGKVSGDLDAVGLALVDAVTTPTAAQAAAAGGVGAARADLLLTRLAASGGAGAGQDAGSDPDVATSAGSDAGGSGSARWGALPPPKLVMRLRFETLLDPTVPAELLTALVGGRLKLTGDAARRLVDERGALLRTILVDDHGAVIGVGRATRRPPGWLADTQLAVHDTCTGPGCDRPAATAQSDHAAPWWPTRPDQPAGATDVANLGPLCDATNRDKEAAGWQVDQSAAGIRTWRHHRSGLTCTTVPATWRPAGDPRHERREHRADQHRQRHRRRPPGTDPPGPHGTGSDPGARPPSDDLPF